MRFQVLAFSKDVETFPPLQNQQNQPSTTQSKPPAMPQLKVLICGAGIAGNALAFWLAKAGHDVTVVERWPCLRVSGLQLDLRSYGIDVMRRMGLEAAVRARCVDEEGLELVDRAGRPWGFFPANRTGRGAQSFSSEFEIMRGDMCRVMYDEARDRAAYLFGASVESYEERGDGVEVRFADGTTRRFDLMVGADGQRSRARRMMLGPEHPEVLELLGKCVAYFTIPREEEEGERWRGRACLMPGSRFFLTRRHSPHRIQVYLGSSADRLGGLRKGDVAAEKEAFARHFRGQSQACDEVLKAMEDTEDFYCEHLGVVKLPSWSSGHVVLIGDAAHCTPANGLGVTSSMVGAYILAGEIEKHCGRSGTKGGLLTALKTYEEKFRPYIAQVQRGISSKKGVLTTLWDKLQDTRVGIQTIYCLVWVAALLRLDRLAGMEPVKIKGWSLPDYHGILEEERT